MIHSFALSLCFLIRQLQSHFILPHPHIKSLEFTEHFQLKKGVPPCDEIYQSFSSSLQPQWQLFVFLFYLAFNISLASSPCGVGQRNGESERQRRGKKITLKSESELLYSPLWKRAVGFSFSFPFPFENYNYIIKNKINWSPLLGFQRTKREEVRDK